MWFVVTEAVTNVLAPAFAVHASNASGTASVVLRAIVLLVTGNSTVFPLP